MTTALQQQIIDSLKAQASISPEEEIARRVDFLAEQIKITGQPTLVLGISGGIDSTVSGKLAQLAVDKAREEGIADACFVAMQLPYGERNDPDAQSALAFINPDEVLITNIQPASDALMESLESSGLTHRDANHRDFNLGNIKARQRMVAQYAVAGARRGLVLGTDQAAEAVTGFFTKYGDGACDLTPLTGLTKRQVRAIGTTLGAPDKLVNKVPTADLESLTPSRPDEIALGVSYEEIDDFLEGKRVSQAAYDTITTLYRQSEHKRQLPKDPS